MKELVFKGENNQVLTNSLLVAEKFDKRHADVIRAIENQLSTNAKVRSLYESSTYIDEQGKERPMYIMNRDGFTLLTMSFTGAKALEFKLDYIDAFNKMENIIKTGGFQVPTTFKEALYLAAKQQEQIEEQQKQIEETAPKVKFANSVETAKESILIAELAKIMKQNGIDTGEKRLYKWLRENKYLCSRGEYKNKPTQKSMQDGLFEIKRTVVEKPGMEPIVFSTTKVTGKGQIYFVNRFLANEKAEA